MKKLAWRKCVSATPGCKVYFYTAKTEEGRLWIAWDRRHEKYILSNNYNNDITVLKSVSEGIKLVDKLSDLK